MRRSLAAVTAIGVMTSAAPLQAHHANIMFDLTTPIWIEGTVVRYEAINPHTLFELDVSENGRVERWTVEGPFLARLKRMGAGDRAVNVGEVLEVCGFPLKQNGSIAPSAAPHFVHGHVLAMPDGRLRAWGPYGKIDNCVRPRDDPQRWIAFLGSDELASDTWCGKAKTATPPRAASRDVVERIDRALPDLCAPPVR